MSKWQPIETAPRDGTWILLQAKGSVIPVIARWGIGEIGKDCWVDGDFSPCPYAPKATHWMPLPEPLGGDDA